MATYNQTRPSCVRVKVKVELLREFSQRINVEMRKKSIGDIVDRWIKSTTVISLSTARTVNYK
ncbi:hypothetical protein HAX54_030069, partial [Datura stramonium]|nr:hypothetical protein [Datura stramonium]